MAGFETGPLAAQGGLDKAGFPFFRRVDEEPIATILIDRPAWVVSPMKQRTFERIRSAECRETAAGSAMRSSFAKK